MPIFQSKFFNIRSENTTNYNFIQCFKSIKVIQLLYLFSLLFINMQRMQQSALYRSIRVVNNEQNKDLPSQPKVLKSRSSSKDKINQFLINSASHLHSSNKKTIKEWSPDKLSNERLSTQKKDGHNNQNSEQNNKALKNSLSKSVKSVKNGIILQAFGQQRQQSESQSLYKYFASNQSRQGKQSRHKRQQSAQQRKSVDTQGLLYRDSGVNNNQYPLQLASVKQSTIQSHISSEGLERQNTINSRSKSRLIKKQHTVKQSLVVDKQKYALSRQKQALSRQKQALSRQKYSTSPEFMVKNKFYHYCAQQIVDLGLGSKESEQNMKELKKQTQKIRQKNIKLQNKIQLQKLCLQQFLLTKNYLSTKLCFLSQQLAQLQQKSQHQLPQTYKLQYKQQYNQHKQDIQTKMSQIKHQQKYICELKRQLGELREQSEEQEQIDGDNQKLRQEIQIIRRKRMEVEEGLYRKSRLIGHLQQVKELEFDNLVGGFMQ